jgi:hypothetical protein
MSYSTKKGEKQLKKVPVSNIKTWVKDIYTDLDKYSKNMIRKPHFKQEGNIAIAVFILDSKNPYCESLFIRSNAKESLDTRYTGFNIRRRQKHELAEKLGGDYEHITFIELRIFPTHDETEIIVDDGD